MTRFWISLFLTALIFPFEASASDAFLSEMCNVVNIVSGPVGKAFAAFAIVSVGIGFFSGKVSWGLLVGVGVATTTIFGAPSIVSAISGDPSFQCSDIIYNTDCSNGGCSTNSSCFNVEEGGTLTMTAPEGKTWAGVTFASYGTPNSCAVSACNAASSTGIVSSACTNRTTCSIAASNSIFSDPCNGTLKRLQVILYYY